MYMDEIPKNKHEYCIGESIHLDRVVVHCFGSRFMLFFLHDLWQPGLSGHNHLWIG